MKKLLYIITFLFISTLGCAGQDQLFTQFYHSPIYLNPALTGCGRNDFRFNFSSRVQWMNLPDPFVYNSASVDKSFGERRLSVGLLLNNASTGYLKSNSLYLSIAQNFGNCSTWFANFAFQLGVGRHAVNKSKLLFADQIDKNGITGFSSSAEILQTYGKNYFDISFGSVFVYGRIMIGLAGHHLAQPYDGLAGNGRDNQLPRRFTGHISYISGEIENPDAFKIKPTIVANLQGKSSSLMAGTLLDFGSNRIEGSLFYRNNANFNRNNNHSFCIGLNIRLGNNDDHNFYNSDTRAQMGFSYDGEINRPGARYTSGSLEFGYMYDKNTGYSDIPCPSENCSNYYPWVFH
jgi:type IX secretion system PorP/SprF family membrane protein